MTRRELAIGSAIGMGAGLLARRVRAADQAPAATAYAAGFVVEKRFADLPAGVVELARKSILDGIGLGFSGSAADSGALARKYLEATGVTRGEGATAIGSGWKSAARFAAFANGVAMHADDYDDTQLAVAKDRVYGLLTHPTSTALAAALAVAETRGMTGRDLLLAYNLGVEVETKVAEAIAPRHYEDGFHSTGTAGTLGAAVAAAKLLGLDQAGVRRAMGIAASEAAGLRENFGTMTKPFHAGRAAENGVVAAELAAMGWTANESILEAPRGYFQAMGGGWDPGAMMGKLGNPWTFVSPGVSIKPSPSGSLTHPGIGEMLRLVRANGITAEQVESVDVGTNRNMPNALIYHLPVDQLQAKFSMEFCIAAALLYGKVGLGEFRSGVVNRPEVQAMMRRVHFGVNAVAEAAGYDKMTTILDIHLKDGRTISGRADFAKGSPANPMSLEEVAAKFADCAEAAGWPKEKRDGIVALVQRLEEVKDVRELTRLCAAG